MKKKILLAEDDADISFIMKTILDKEGYEVTSINNGNKLTDSQDSLPDLYILDKQMPGMDGLDVCRYLKSHERTKDIPVIIVSATPGFHAQVKEVGAEDFLEKPFQTTKLVAIVHKYLD